MKPTIKTTPKPTACTYARVSLDQQTDNFSLPSQRRAMLKLAEEKGYHVPPEFEFVDGGCLGGEMDRPEFVRMRAAVRSGLVKAVICYDPDRLVRGPTRFRWSSKRNARSTTSLWNLSPCPPTVPPKVE